MTPLRWALVALGVLLVANVMLGADRSFAKSEARRYAREADSLRTVAARVDTVYRDRVRTLTREVVKRDTLRATLTITDTLEVIRFIAAQDTALTACLAVVETCESRVANRDAQIDALSGQLRATLAQRPGLRERLRPLIIVGGLAYLAGRMEIP